MIRYVDAEIIIGWFNHLGRFKIAKEIERLADKFHADVVSREQYNLCYEECLRLRVQNEHLMDSLRTVSEQDDDLK